MKGWLVVKDDVECWSMERLEVAVLAHRQESSVVSIWGRPCGSK
jgi:hypothetical protein